MTMTMKKKMQLDVDVSPPASSITLIKFNWQELGPVVPDKITLFYTVTLTFDLWPWSCRMT